MSYTYSSCMAHITTPEPNTNPDPIKQVNIHMPKSLWEWLKVHAILSDMRSGTKMAVHILQQAKQLEERAR